MGAARVTMVVLLMVACSSGGGDADDESAPAVAGRGLYRAQGGARPR